MVSFKLLKNELEFKQNVEYLVEAMYSACKCLMDVRYHTKVPSARELFGSIMKTVRDAALSSRYIGGRGRLGEFGSKLCMGYLAYKPASR